MGMSKQVDKNGIKDKLLQCDLFNCLSDDQFSLILEEGKISILDKGEFLYSKGEEGNSISYILKGSVTVFSQEPHFPKNVLAELHEHDIVGETAIFFKGKRGANVVAESGLIVFTLSDTLVRKLLNDNGRFKGEIRKISLQRMKENFAAHYFMSYFPEIGSSVVQTLIKNIELITIQKGETLYEKGDPCDSLYFLVRGRLEAKLFDQTVRQVKDLFFTSGETIGEIGAFSKRVRDVTVKATRNSFVLKLSMDAFNEIKKEHPSITEMLLKIFMQKLEDIRNGNHRYLNPKTVAVIPLHPSLDIEGFINKLSLAFSGLNYTSLIADLNYVENRFNIDNFSGVSVNDPQYIFLNSMFSKLEKDHDFCFYLVNQQSNAWTRYCLDNADEIVLLADSTSVPDLTSLEIDLSDSIRDEITPKRLILVHPENVLHPKGTSKWLSERSVLQHHHIKETFQEEDISRLSRFISNHAVGLVLSGGGARGNAHIGVCDALIDNDIPIDFIGGTSHGALIGAIYDAYCFKQDIINPLMKKFLRGFSFDLTLPLVSLVSAKSLEKVLEEIFGDIQIEDLWIPFFCVSSNLTRSEPRFHTRGGLARAVRASTSIPGIFPPVIEDGEILVDGGLINNLPIRPMRELLRGGTVIASFVTQEIDNEESLLPNLSLSGWKYLLHQLNLLPSKSDISVPNIASLLIRSGTVSSTYEQNVHEKQDGPDLMIKPSVGHFKTLKYDQIEEIRKIGYQSTVDALPELKKIQS